MASGASLTWPRIDATLPATVKITTTEAVMLKGSMSTLSAHHHPHFEAMDNLDIKNRTGRVRMFQQNQGVHCVSPIRTIQSALSDVLMWRVLQAPGGCSPK